MRSVLVGALVLVSCACSVRRTLHVTSEPAGAEVRLDDVLVGRTPLVHRFDHYGTRKLTLYHEGCCTWSESIRLDPPWWNRFPLDYLTEILLPFGWKDKRRVHVPMDPGKDVLTRPDLQSVFDRKRALSSAGPEGPTDFPEPVARPVPTAEDP